MFFVLGKLYLFKLGRGSRPPSPSYPVATQLVGKTATAKVINKTYIVLINFVLTVIVGYICH